MTDQTDSQKKHQKADSNGVAKVKSFKQGINFSYVLTKSYIIAENSDCLLLKKNLSFD